MRLIRKNNSLKENKKKIKNILVKVDGRDKAINLVIHLLTMKSLEISLDPKNKKTP